MGDGRCRTGYLNDKWRASYEGVVRANATLRLLKQVVDGLSRALCPAADARGDRRERRNFLRAHFHFEAWRMWGNVPYFREDDTDLPQGRTSRAAAVMTEIIKDLDAAIAAAAGHAAQRTTSDA